MVCDQFNTCLLTFKVVVRYTSLDKKFFGYICRPVLRDTLSRTNLVVRVMVDDPVFSAHLGEFIVNLQSGLMMGSKTAGVTTPGGSLLLTSNDNVLPR